MASTNPFRVYDVVTATDASIQVAHDNGFRIPPTDETTVLAVSDERVLLSDGSFWHHSHFKKVGESILKEEIQADLQAELEEADTELAVEALAQMGSFDEFTLILELAEYVSQTYGEHYAKDGVQAFALIAKRPERGLNFAIGNVIKYADRFGEKGGRNRADLLKVAHYTILAIHCLDKLEGAK